MSRDTNVEVHFLNKEVHRLEAEVAQLKKELDRYKPEPLEVGAVYMVDGAPAFCLNKFPDECGDLCFAMRDGSCEYFKPSDVGRLLLHENGKPPNVGES